jgi:hypothetical protein
MSQTGAAYFKTDLNEVLYIVNATLKIIPECKHSHTLLSVCPVQHFFIKFVEKEQKSRLMA